MKRERSLSQKRCFGEIERERGRPRAHVHGTLRVLLGDTFIVLLVGRQQTSGCFAEAWTSASGPEGLVLATAPKSSLFHSTHCAL